MYLTQAPSFVKALLQVMYMYVEIEEDDTKKNALGAVQKLSFLMSFAKMMIENEILQWIIC